MPSPLSHQSHAARMRYIAELRAQHGSGKKRKSVVQFPDLSVKQTCAPRGDNKPCKFSSERKTGGQHKDAVQFPVGNSHKQGPMLITPGAVKNGELKHLSGKKT